MDNKKVNYILTTSIISISILFIVEQVMMASYLNKTITKIIMFTLIPIRYIIKIKKVTIQEGLKIKRLSLKTIYLGITLGIGVVFVIGLSYYIFRNLIDINSIVYELETKSKVTQENYIMVATYFCIGNSFLEEFFFRGYIFLNLYEVGHKKFAYNFSAILFALYHIAIFRTWFSVGILLLCLLGLYIGAIIFNYVDTKSNNFLNSWIIHILADIMIASIGYMYLF